MHAIRKKHQKKNENRRAKEKLSQFTSRRQGDEFIEVDGKAA